MPNNMIIEKIGQAVNILNEKNYKTKKFMSENKDILSEIIENLF